MTFPAEDLLDIGNEGWCHLLLACLVSGWQWCILVFLPITTCPRKLSPFASDWALKALHLMYWCGTQCAHTLLNPSSLWTWTLDLHCHTIVRLSTDFPELGILQYCHWCCACPCHRKSFYCSTMSFQLLYLLQLDHRICILP